MNSKIRNIVFILFAILAFAVMLYHTIGFVQPFDNTPAWRHILFIGICCSCIYGLLKRPKWFVWFFGILTLQQLYSHGLHFVKLIQEDKINFTDAAVIIFMPLLLIFLLMDRKKNTSF